MIPATSVLDRREAVLVVIDIQERLAAAMAHREKVSGNTALLVRVAAIVGIPVIATRQYPKGLGDLDVAIGDVLSQTEQEGSRIARVDKLTFDCFKEESFKDAVCETGRRQLLIAGMETHICVTQTALTGLREGYDVHVAADACCSRREEAHSLALARLGNAGAVLTTAESAAYELVGVAGTPEFKSLLAAVKG